MKGNWKKRLAVLALAAVSCVSLAAPVSAAAEGWRKDGAGWWYRDADGGYPAVEWRNIHYNEYYFDADGYMATGWRQIDGKWYYFAPVSDPPRYEGAMYRDTVLELDGSLYLLGTDGALVTNGIRYRDGEIYAGTRDGTARRCSLEDVIKWEVPEGWYAGTSKSGAPTLSFYPVSYNSTRNESDGWVAYVVPQEFIRVELRLLPEGMTQEEWENSLLEQWKVEKESWVTDSLRQTWYRTAEAESFSVLKEHHCVSGPEVRDGQGSCDYVAVRDGNLQAVITLECKADRRRELCRAFADFVESIAISDIFLP